MQRKEHWEALYETKPSDTVSWYEPLPSRSLTLLTDAGLNPDSAVLDVGGGDSRLAGAVVDRDVRDITVLDLSGAALRRAQADLGDRAGRVRWIEGDITTVELPPSAFDFWHDRAVFHFLTADEDRARYVATAARSVRIGGTVIVATFALDGPTRCSGLEVVRYSPEGLAQAFGEAFDLRQGFVDVHRTPTGAEQRFSFAVLSRV